MVADWQLGIYGRFSPYSVDSAPAQVRNIYAAQRMRRLSSYAGIFILLACVLPGCAPGKRPFLIAQVCLSTAEEVTTFTRELKSIARSEGVKFIDNSENTQNELHAIGNPHLEKTMTRPIINMGIERGHGIGLIANNVGSPGGEVAIGFSEGWNPPAAHQFAQRVIGELKQHWPIEIVPNPAESGALPMTNCN